MGDTEMIHKNGKAPVIYRLQPESGHTIRLEFDNSQKISHFDQELSGYSYTLNGKKYIGVSCLKVKDTEEITDRVSVSEDQYGSKVLCIFTPIPTFDSGDREWDSRMTEYLMFDGKDINLIVMRGGYQIASLTFYTKLIAADIGLKAYFEKLGFPVNKVEWKE